MSLHSDAALRKLAEAMMLIVNAQAAGEMRPAHADAAWEFCRQARVEIARPRSD